MQNKIIVVDNTCKVNTDEDDRLVIILASVAYCSDEQYRIHNLDAVPILIDHTSLDEVAGVTKGSWAITIHKSSIYAFAYGNGNKYSLQRLISKPNSGKVVDHHPNHYGLDNRRCNLHNVTRSENSRNSIWRGEKRALIVPTYEGIETVQMIKTLNMR